MRTILLLAMLMIGLAAPAGEDRPTVTPFETPHQTVERIAALERVRPDDLRAIWWMESREAVKYRDGQAGEQGPFQVLAIAAEEARCLPGWEDDFTLNAQCGARYLRLGYERCGRQIGWAAHFYNRGSCPAKGKIFGYAQETQRAKARITMRRKT